MRLRKAREYEVGWPPAGGRLKSCGVVREGDEAIPFPSVPKTELLLVVTYQMFKLRTQLRRRTNRSHRCSYPTYRRVALGRETHFQLRQRRR